MNTPVEQLPTQHCDYSFIVFNAAIDLGLAGLLTRREWTCFCIHWRVAARKTGECSLDWWKPTRSDHRPAMNHLQGARKSLVNMELLFEVKGRRGVFRLATADQLQAAADKLQRVRHAHSQLGSKSVTPKMGADHSQMGTDSGPEPAVKPLPNQELHIIHNTDHNSHQNIQNNLHDLVTAAPLLIDASPSIQTRPNQTRESRYFHAESIFVGLWEKKHAGRKFTFPISKAVRWRRAFKDLLIDCDNDLAEFERRAGLFFADPNPFFGAQEDHPPTKMLLHITRYQGPTLPPDSRIRNYRIPAIANNGCPSRLHSNERLKFDESSIVIIRGNKQ